MGVFEETNIRMVRGDSLARQVRVVRDGKPLVLGHEDTGRFALFDENGQPVLVKTLGAADCRGDALIVTLAPEDTEPLDEGDYRCELELVLTDGTVITPLRGKLRLFADLITPTVRGGKDQ